MTNLSKNKNDNETKMERILDVWRMSYNSKRSRVNLFLRYPGHWFAITLISSGTVPANPAESSEPLYSSMRKRRRSKPKNKRQAAHAKQGW